MHISDLTDSVFEHYLATPGLDQGAINYARTELARGLDYYRARIRRLGLKGQRALDAGCGVGNWSIALAKHFQRVDGLEWEGNPSRLQLFSGLNRQFDSNIFPYLGSIENTPYENECFDTIFCNGVLYITDYRKTLAEFARILRPGGTLYVMFAGRGWWKHLICDRGPSEPNCVGFGCDALLNHIFRLLDQICFEAITAGITWNISKQTTSLLTSPSEPADDLLETAQIELSRIMRGITTLYSAGASSSGISSALNEDIAILFKFGSMRHRWRLCKDILSRLIIGRPDYSVEKQTHSFEPHEMDVTLAEYGFTTCGSGPEGYIIVDPNANDVAPLYAPSQGVYEILATRNSFGYGAELLSSSYYFENARQAASKYSGIYGSEIITRSKKLPIYVCNTRQAADHVNPNEQSELLKTLVRTIIAGSSSDTDACFRIYRFIQDALFHHPTFQLLKDNGDIEDSPLRILLSGTGRCGHVAKLAVALFSLAGFNARITQLFRHVCAEVEIDGRWLLLDADFFKSGTVPQNLSGEWLTLEEARQTPWLLDRVPATGIMLDPDARWGMNYYGKKIHGYVDTGLAWHRPYVSYLYFGGQKAYPATPPEIICRTRNRTLTVQATSKSTDIQAIKIFVDTHSRGWKYTDFPDSSYLRPPQGNIAVLQATPEQLEQGISVEVPDGDNLYLNLYAYDAYALSTPSIYVWPSHEHVINTKTSASTGTF